MQSIERFIEERGIEADVEWADSNPNMAESGAQMNHWAVTLRANGRGMAVPFSTGLALDEPTAADVLDSLASDFSFVADGCELDSMPHGEAKGIEASVGRLRFELEALIGKASVETLMYGVERL